MTAEVAVVLPAVVLVAMSCAWVCAVVGAQVRCVDAAHTGARALARGEAPEAARAAALAVAPREALVVMRRADGRVSVAVRARVTGVRGTPPVEVGATANGLDETSGADAPALAGRAAR